MTGTTKVVLEGQAHPFWQAVLERDERYDGVVFYAVSTTGVFCRPICPSRRPRRENVSFFADPSAAREAGFRPCKRCHPESIGPATADKGDLVRACRVIESHESPTLSTLADALGTTPDRIRALFRRELGVSPKQYAESMQLGRFKAGVRAGESVAAATYEAGYGSSRRIYEKAGERLGMTPASYARSGEGQHVEFWTWTSSLGPVIVAATERGLCSVRFGASAPDLETELRAEFSNAEITRSERTDKRVQAVKEFLDGERPLASDIPTDVLATAFQAKVWAALRAIPSGETRSYSDVAAAIGEPRAVRAVASACARNPVALVVPCHRVLPKGADAASPGKYRWGPQTKRELLTLETNLGPAAPRK